ncbi:MAG: hypothetical protein IJE89_00415 [Bacilli bacterium]|nr:hypothetical protein [Bacilli bacterium]
MSKELFEKRRLEFIGTIATERRLPKTWEYSFSDGEDMRVWFDKISNMETFKSFVDKVNEILLNFNKKILTDKEKEAEFLNCVETICRIPQKNEYYFSDNTDMYMWYMEYKRKNESFETEVYINLPEYEEFDLAETWSLIKEEFIIIIKKIKKIPEFGRIFLSNGIDVRVVCEKLKKYDPDFIEKLLLHITTYNKNSLSQEKRIEELKETISILGYIPELQEVRFSDGTDMFTWYMRKKEEIPNLETEITSLISKSNPNQKVNIYLIPNFKSKGGKFYTICTNVGEKLDLSNITSFEEAQKLDPTIVKRGGLILRKDEEIGSASFGKGKKN